MKNIIAKTLVCCLALPFFAMSQSTVPDSLVEITTILPGHTKPSTLTAAVKNGIAVIQGDIILGPLDKIQQEVQERGLVIENLDLRWPNGVIPYEIDGNFSAAYRDLILKAIDYINGSTNLLLVPRGIIDPYWIKYEPSDVCESYIGLNQFGGQVIKLQDITITGFGCGFPQIIHETAHAAGLWHEQCRGDRDNFIDVHWENIPEDKKHNFEKNIDDNIDIGSYDFDSRMHYFSNTFAINTALPTITRKNGSTAMGNSSDYSQGDVNAINWLYPVKNCASSYLLSRSLQHVDRPLFYQSSWTINSSTTIDNNNNITYDAATEIILQPGFSVLPGSQFRAVIDGCGGLVVPLLAPDTGWYTEAGSYEERIAQMQSDAQVEQNETTNLVELKVAPNPFSGSTLVTYTLSVEQPVAMLLLDATGKLVATPLATQTQSAGEHQVNLEANNLPVGLYFLVIQMGGKRETKRLILTQ